MSLTELKKLISKNSTSRYCDNEEQTKTGLVLPFLQYCGINPFDLDELVPEFTAEVGTKKGEKVDYLLFKDDEPFAMIECKALYEDLDDHHSQLYRYFATMPSVKIAILTNGEEWRVYSDFDVMNVMDYEPSYSFALQDADNSKDFENFRRILSEGVEFLQKLKKLKEAEEELTNESSAERKQRPGESFSDYLERLGSYGAKIKTAPAGPAVIIGETHFRENSKKKALCKVIKHYGMLLRRRDFNDINIKTFDEEPTGDFIKINNFYLKVYPQIPQLKNITLKILKKARVNPKLVEFINI